MTSALRKLFGLKVKELRLASGLSQEGFADRCGFARSYMSRIERGAANPSLDAIGVLAAALGVGCGELVGGIELSNQRGIMVPFARDGTCFNPTLRSAGSYAVGEKSMAFYSSTFGEALHYLAGMKTAKWWRPNSVGNRGLVSAVKWAPLPDEYYSMIDKV